MYNRAKIFMFFLILLILFASFVLIALWMMITLNPGSQSGAVYLLFDQIGKVAVAVMEVLAGALIWLIDRFWSLIGFGGFISAFIPLFCSFQIFKS